MRIVLLCNEYPPRPHAGIGTATQAIARGLSGRGHDITVVGIGNANEEHSDGGIRVITLEGSKLRYLGNLLTRIRLKRFLSDLVREKQIQIVEAIDSQGMLPFGLNRCVLTLRLQLSFSAVGRIPMADERVGRGIALYEKWTAKQIPNWIAVSDYVLDLSKSAFGVSPVLATTAYNPVPPLPSAIPDVPGLPANFILFAGHVCKRKGADILAHAARRTMLQYPDLHLVYAGGVFKQERRSISESILNAVGSDLHSRVHFLGRLEREKVIGLMKRAKAFVFPSHVEGFPLVVLEAMSCGTPVVYTKLPPGPEIIEDGVTGLLADPASPEDFGNRIAKLIQNPELAATLGAKGRQSVANRFSVDQCVKVSEDFYSKCLKSSANGPSK